MGERRRSVSRRSFLKGTAAAGVVAGNIGALADLAQAASNSITTENLLVGSAPSVWEDTGSDTIQGFTDDISYAPGDTVTIKVDTPSKNYTIQIFRLGWYQGNGARLLQSIPIVLATARTQPAPITNAATGLIDCGNWTTTATWTVPANAVSGVYFILLKRNDVAESNHIVFVVRRATASDLLVQTSDTTWTAYNRYGGNSLYFGDPAGRAYKVSYNRPSVPDVAENDFFSTEYALVRFLERNGYDVAYCAGVDADRTPSLLLNRKVFISSGHDEYWSGNQRTAVTAARNAGVNLIFFSGNEVFWKTRLEASIAPGAKPNRTLVCYKETLDNGKTDPTPAWTGTWRDARFSPPADGGKPENALTGQLFLCINPVAADDFALQVPYEYSRLRFWRNTAVASLPAGQTKTLTANTLGYEWDADVDNGFRPPGLIRLSATTATAQSVLIDNGSTYVEGTVTHNLTMYRAASGAVVFGAGTVQWAYGLDDYHSTDSDSPTDPIIQQATVNLLADMGTQPGSLQSGLVSAAKSTDTLPPVTTITAPASGAVVTIGTPVTVTGTATDAGGGNIAGVEVSIDGGATWHAATGKASWSDVVTPTVLGPLVIKARAIDDSLNIETTGPSRTLTVNPRPTPCPIFATSDVPSAPDGGDATAIEAGVRFRASSDGFITALRFYKASTNTGAHVGHLWTNSGALLATATFSGESASGWQTATISPVAINGNTTYVASVYMPNGHYSADVGFFNQAYDLQPLRALANGEDGPNGVYNYGASGFPASTFGATNYWVDIVFSGNSNAAPTVTDSAPANNMQSVATNATIFAAFSKPMNPASIVVSVKNPANVAVAGTVAYDSTTRRATFTPSAALAPLTRFTVSVTGSDTGGIAMTAPVTFAFTTIGVPGTSPASLWDTSATPTTLAAPDTAAVEVGMRFTAETAGTIAAFRYYKAPGSSGVATGHLWDAAGTLLATAPFATTSASGWQQVNLATPVAITANTTYVVSYSLPNGVYSYSAGYWSAAGTDRAPLHTPIAGGNGVYRYGGNVYPNLPAGGTNYWVDVIFVAVPDNSPPTVVDTRPGAGLVSVAPTLPVMATFSEAINPATLVFSVTSSAGPAAAAVTYDSASRTATLTPTTALTAGTTYTASVRATDVAGNAMPAPTTWTFTTTSLPGNTPTTLWDTSNVPTIPTSNDGTGIELGVRFTADRDGAVSAIRFYKGAGNTGTHIGHLWSATGTLLGTASFTSETAGGWQQAKFATAVPVTANTTYVASLFSSAGHYSATMNYFTSTAVTNPPLRSPATAGGAGNGLYIYGTGGMPTSTYNGTNYWVDLVFDSTSGPVVTSHTPATGALAVPANTTVTAVFDRAVQSSTVIMQLRDGGGALVSGATTYNAATFTSTFTPTAALSSAATYTASVSGAKDTQGNTMATVSWSFTVADAAATSIWGPTAVPANTSADDNGQVELGVRFRASVAGTIRGIYFYKGAGNTGTHVGHLWTNAGALLATVQFANETASGWQYASLATPVPVTAGTTYVASYYAPAGHYAYDGGYFASAAHTNGPVSALANGTDGANGVYIYAAGGAFPSSSWNSTNYWVDIAFQAGP